jgi:hypothetical protein
MKTNKTTQNEDTASPVLVKNPFTGDYINILPLFERMNEAAFSNGAGPDEMVRSMQFIHDHTSTVSLTPESDPAVWSAVNMEVLLLRKMFERMSVVRA